MLPHSSFVDAILLPPSPAIVSNHSIGSVLKSLVQLRQDALHAEALFADAIAAVHPPYQSSARNLVHYLALRSHDLRGLQVRRRACRNHAICNSHVLQLALDDIEPI